MPPHWSAQRASPQRGIQAVFQCSHHFTPATDAHVRVSFNNVADTRAAAERRACKEICCRLREVCMQAFSTRHRIAGGLGVIALALAACGSSSPSSPSAANSGAPTATPTAPITPGGTLNIGLTQEPTSFLADGWVDSMTFGINAVAPAREPLVQLRSNDETANAKTLA